MVFDQPLVIIQHHQCSLTVLLFLSEGKGKTKRKGEKRKS